MRWFGILALLAALTACSDSSDSALPPTTTPPTSTLVAAPVTTPAPTTTTTQLNGLAVSSEEAAVLEAHEAYLAMFDVVGDPPNPDHPELARRATGDAYERLRANLVQAQAVGQTLSGGWKSGVVSVDIDGDKAVVTDCLLDLGVLRNADGSIAIPADSEPSLQTTELVKQGAAWRVTRLNLPKPRQPCDA